MTTPMNASMTTHTLLRLALGALLWACLSTTPWAQATTPLEGHYRLDGRAGSFHIRILNDGRVEVLSAVDGSRRIVVPSVVQPNLIMGVVEGESWSVGASFGRLMASVGDQTFTLTQVSAETYAAAGSEARRRVAAQAAEGGGLGGLDLSHASSSPGGYFDGREYTFCSDGSFRLSKSVGGPGVAGEQQFSGRWRVAGGQVQFTFSNGGSSVVALRRIADGVFELDGRRYSATRSSSCR